MTPLDAEITALETKLGLLRAERARLARPLTVAEVLDAATEPLSTREVARRCGRQDVERLRAELGAIARRISSGPGTLWTARRGLRVVG